MDQGKVIGEVLERKNALFEQKRQRFKKGLRFAFLQRVQSIVFVEKLSPFPSFVLMEMEQKTPIGEASERKKAFFDYEKHRF